MKRTRAFTAVLVYAGRTFVLFYDRCFAPGKLQETRATIVNEISTIDRVLQVYGLRYSLKSTETRVE